MNVSGSWLTTSKNVFLSGQCWIQKEFTSQWLFENRSLFHSALIINIPLCMDNRCQYSDNDSIILIFLQHHQLWYLFQTQFISLLLPSQWSISGATCMFLFILSLSRLTKKSPLSLLSLSTYAVQLAHKILMYSATFFSFFSPCPFCTDCIHQY